MINMAIPELKSQRIKSVIVDYIHVLPSPHHNQYTPKKILLLVRLFKLIIKRFFYFVYRDIRLGQLAKYRRSLFSLQLQITTSIPSRKA